MGDPELHVEMHWSSRLSRIQTPSSPEPCLSGLQWAWEEREPDLSCYRGRNRLSRSFRKEERYGRYCARLLRLMLARW